MHSTGSMYSISSVAYFSLSFLGWIQSTGHASTQAVSLVPIQGSAITYAIFNFSVRLYFTTLIVAYDPTGWFRSRPQHFAMRETLTGRLRMGRDSSLRCGAAAAGKLLG